MRCFFQVEFRAVHKGKLLFKGSRLDMKGALASSKLVRVESEMSPRGSRLGIGASETTRYGKSFLMISNVPLAAGGRGRSYSYRVEEESMLWSYG